ncbi:MAG: 2OG-Fe(II) oxygenase [Planctomycetales bacterium]|nr:2OG-Fe(II) oxygenase [Planctomycetales bacterium]
MSLLNFEAIRTATVHENPFPYLLVDQCLQPEAWEPLLTEFPSIEQGGSFPLSALSLRPSYQSLCEELQGETLRQCFGSLFKMDLVGYPTTLTVRGRCRAKDGKIHTDSKSKLITVLLYLNEPWTAEGGRLRLLHSKRDINNAFAEIAPNMGTLVAFRNGPTAWHGHTSFDGARRAMQLNWVRDENAVRRSSRRHGLSAIWKRLTGVQRAA